MKISELTEMTINIRFPQTDEKINPYFNYLQQHGKHIGDQDGLEIWSTTLPDMTILYGIKNENNILTTLCSFKPVSPTLWELGFIHTIKPFRGTKHSLKILWFVKNQEGKSIVDSGAMTSDGIKMTKMLSASKRFKVYWYNIVTKQKVNYDRTSDNFKNVPYRSNVEKTDWRILIESDNKPSFERYDTNFVKGLYQVFC